MTAPAFLGEFRGSGNTPAQLDALLAFALSKRDLEDSRSLFSSKWWDYRFVHPGHGFFLFADLFARAVGQWRTMFGVNPYAQLKVTDHPLWRTPTRSEAATRTGDWRKDVQVDAEPTLTPQAFRTGLWRAMCHADAHGVPYDRFISHAFQHAFDCQWQRMPMPTSLYSDGMVKAILARWEEERDQILVLPKDPIYHADNYQGHAWQDGFQDWLCELIARRPVPVIPLTQYVGRERLILPQRAAQRFGLTLVSDAIHRARS